MDQKGFTLVEMLIASVLGLFVTGVIITVFSTNVRSSTENIQMVRLNQELRGVMALMTDELKRAGYSADSQNSDFMDELNFTSTCVRYSYDDDANKVQDSDEHFGFRLQNNKVEWSRNATGTGCTGGTWAALTTIDVASIVTLDFDISGSINSLGETGVNALTTTNGVTLIDVGITLVGQKQLPHTITPAKRTIFDTVRLRNETPK